MNFPLPEYLKAVPVGRERDHAEDRFYILLAAAYASRKGTTRALAARIGVNYRTLWSAANGAPPHRVTADTYARIKEVLGSEFVPPNR